MIDKTNVVDVEFTDVTPDVAPIVPDIKSKKYILPTSSVSSNPLVPFRGKRQAR